MSSYEPIRSYQRLFRPQRRIYSVEGRPLPVPGGVPLRWAVWALASFVAVLVLEARSPAVELLLAGVAALAGLGLGGRLGAAVAAALALVGSWLLGLALGALDWPLRLLVVPAALATLATQATPDGRRPERFARSWLAWRLSPPRRSLGRALPTAGRPRRLAGEVWLSPDERSPRLRRARVRGPALLFFADPVVIERSRLGRRLVARPPAGGRGEEPTRRLLLGEGEALEVRP